MADANGNVTFSTKELILQLDAKLDALMTVIGQKASAQDVSTLQGKVFDLEGKLTHRDKRSHDHANDILILKDKVNKLENKQVGEDAVHEYRKWLLGGGAFLGLNAVIQTFMLFR